MGFQTAVQQNPDKYGPPGSRHGAGHAPERPFHNSQTPVLGVHNIALVFAGGESHTITINGVPVVVAGNTDSATTAVDALAALQADTNLAAIAVFTAGVAGSVVATEVDAGSINSITGAGSGAATTTVSTVTAAVTADGLDGGLVVHGDSAMPGVARLPRAAPSGTVFLAGIVAHTHRGIDRNAASGSQYDYPPGVQVPVGYRGPYVMTAETAVARSSTLYYRITATANGSQLGAIRADDTDGGACIALPGAKALGDISAAGKVPVAINLS